MPALWILGHGENAMTVDDDEKIVSFESAWIGHGFTQFWNVVLLNGSLSLGARMLWATLAYFARQTDEAWPGQETIALKLGSSERSVRTWLRELEDCGLVSTKRRMSRSNLYRLHDPSPAYVAELERQLLPPHPAEIAGEKKTQVKKTQVEEEQLPGADGALFNLEPTAPEKPKDDTDEKVQRIWEEFERCFPGRYRSGLSDSRTKVLKSGLKAINGDLGLALDAVRGLKAYRTAHPEGSQNVDVSVVFKTSMHDNVSLTEKIERWARNVDGQVHSDVMADVPQLLRGRVNALRETVLMGYIRDNLETELVTLALSQLREQFAMEPESFDGRKVTWRKVA